MTIRDTINHITNSSKQTVIDFKNDVKETFNRFKAAPAREKIWVLAKTFVVAVASGLIVLAIGTLLGSPGIIPVVAGVVCGGVYAFYRFARQARSLEELTIRQAVQNVKDVGNQVLEAVGVQA